MSAITTLILTMVLAVSGASTNVSFSEANDTPPSRIAINHNETMLGSSLAAGQAYTLADLLADIKALIGSKPTPGGGCDEWMCGGNHNETMLVDAAPTQPTSMWDDWLTSFEAFFSTKPIPGGCDEWGCGMNHNETMLSPR